MAVVQSRMLQVWFILSNLLTVTAVYFSPFLLLFYAVLTVSDTSTVAWWSQESSCYPFWWACLPFESMIYRFIAKSRVQLPSSDMLSEWMSSRLLWAPSSTVILVLVLLNRWRRLEMSWICGPGCWLSRVDRRTGIYAQLVLKAQDWTFSTTQWHFYQVLSSL